MAFETKHVQYTVVVYFTHTGITTLIIAATNIDVVIAISLFSLFIGLIFSDGHILLDVFRGPLEIVIGLLYGTICGIALWYLPTKDHVSYYSYL